VDRRRRRGGHLLSTPADIERIAAYDPAQLSGGAGGAEPTLRYVLVDVFTRTPLEGNQLAVFTDARGVTQATMQSLARELKLSETVFVLPTESGADARVRIFTPAHELPFAGHPVLGSAVVLGTALARSSVTLETGVGAVAVELEPDGSGAVSGTMRQAAPSWRAYERERNLLAALGVARSRLPVEAYDNGPLHVYVALDSPAAVAALRPDMGALEALAPACANCFADAGGHWKTRMFAPSAGVPEDPATGSAAGPLALHLSRHGRIRFGEEIEIHQGAEISRPSVLFARAVGSAEQIQRVEVRGSAVMVASGRFLRGRVHG
jgi:trans-2,3-dihydro-3-hydroxyanthranilate isomerase